jgi:hypothetical protein
VRIFLRKLDNVTWLDPDAKCDHIAIGVNEFRDHHNRPSLFQVSHNDHVDDELILKTLAGISWNSRRDWSRVQTTKYILIPEEYISDCGLAVEQTPSGIWRILDESHFELVATSGSCSESDIECLVRRLILEGVNSEKKTKSELKQAAKQCAHEDSEEHQ